MTSPHLEAMLEAATVTLPGGHQVRTTGAQRWIHWCADWPALTRACHAGELNGIVTRTRCGPDTYGHTDYYLTGNV